MLRSTDAETIGKRAIEVARVNKLAPMCVVVLDAAGRCLYLRQEDGNPLLRESIARGKAQAALGLNTDSGNVGKMYQERPHFVGAAFALASNQNMGLVPVPGGVLVRDPNTNAVLGAVGVSGDLSDKDEACAIEGVKAAGLSCALLKEGKQQTVLKASL